MAYTYRKWIGTGRVEPIHNKNRDICRKIIEVVKNHNGRNPINLRQLRKRTKLDKDVVARNLIILAETIPLDRPNDKPLIELRRHISKRNPTHIAYQIWLSEWAKHKLNMG